MANLKQNHNSTTYRILRYLLLTMTIAAGNTLYAKSSDIELKQLIKQLKASKSVNYHHYRHHILYAYLQYLDIKHNPDNIDPQSLIHYLHANKNTVMEKSVRTRLLEQYAEQQQWHTIIQHYNPTYHSTSSNCLYLEARLRTGQRTAIPAAKKLWLSGVSRPKNCKGLFGLLEKHKALSQDDYWQRINLALQKGSTSLASHLSKKLNSKDRELARLWIKSRKSPQTVLSSNKLKQRNTKTADIITYAMKRYARKSSASAQHFWQNTRLKSQLAPQQTADIESYLGVRLALNHNKQAIPLLEGIPAHLRSDDAHEWLARMQIRRGQWLALKRTIQHMPNELKQKDRWRYWLAEAQGTTGKASQGLLQTLAKDASFYGFLAADKIKRPYRMIFHQEANYAAQTKHIAQQHDIRFSKALFDIGESGFAKQVWFKTIESFNPHNKLVAAAYAHHIGQPFTAISTVSKTKQWNLINLRFPVLYKNDIMQYSRQQGISPAWSYGITRRESAFDPEIISHANARGLMQILPATARDVAKRLGIRKHHRSDLMDPTKNIRLGTAYLSQLIKKFSGNYAEASAGYNAGPQRIKKWAPEKTIRASQWIESIPFNETRKYVRAVLGYSMIYHHKLNPGQPLRLHQWLKPIHPR